MSRVTTHLIAYAAITYLLGGVLLYFKAPAYIQTQLQVKEHRK